MSLVFGVSVSTDTEIDLEVWECSLQLSDEFVIRITCPCVQCWLQRDNFERLCVNPRESIDQMRAEGESRLDVVQLELSWPCG